MLLSIITHRKAWCISKLSVCCTDETSLRFHVWRLDEVLKFARGILKHLWGRLKETEQINHKTNFLLNLQVMINSKSLLCCLSLQQCYKLSQVACNSLLCLIIDRHLASDIISPLFWRPLAKLPLWVFYLCDLMSCRPIRFMYVYVLKVYFCVCVCLVGEVWPQLHASTSHSKEWGLSLQYVWLSRVALQCTVYEPV